MSLGSSIISWLADKLGTPVPVSYNGDLIGEYEELIGNIYIRELAFWNAVNILSNAISKCEFETYVNNKKVKGPEYFLWNYEPNKNQNSSAFIHKLIAKLCRENECLVVEQGSQLLIADSFTKAESTINGDTFSQVIVGDFTFQRDLNQSEVLYFKLAEQNIKKVVNGIYDSYSELITYTVKSYKRSKGIKGIFKYNALPVKGSEERKAFDDLINKKIKDWLLSDAAALPLGKNAEWKELEYQTGKGDSTRDIRAMIDDISDFTARGFGIPPALMKGDVADTSKTIDQLLTFSVDPLADNIQEEITRKRYGYKEFSKGNYLRVDTKSIKHIDLLSVATAIDKLIGSGAFCIDDILEALGEQPKGEDWSQQHFITKNYELVEEALKNLEGGNKA
jgi:HK97 family phage portal protein